MLAQFFCVIFLSDPLRDYLADSVHAFLGMHATTNYTPADEPDETPDVVHLGLTFSFPVEQTALGSGKILTWTKGFSAKNAVGQDVVKLLQDAFDRKHMHVKCVALVNDVCIASKALIPDYTPPITDCRRPPISCIPSRWLCCRCDIWYGDKWCLRRRSW